MTKLVFQDPPDNPTLQRFGLDFAPATLGETLGAVAGDPTLAPTGMISTQIERTRERGEDIDPVFAQGATAPPARGLTPFVDPDALNLEYGHLGLKFDKATRRGEAEVVAREKRREIAREDVLRRGPSGPMAFAAQLGTALAVSALDPINVASAFVPVVSQARYAGFVARVGTTGARVSRGVIEGTVGAGLVEPFVATMARSQQLDYQLSDAMMNVALGGILGGGLHAVGGKIGDLMVRATPETREGALRASVAQMAEGRPVDIEAVIRADLGIGTDPRLRSGLLSSAALPVEPRGARILESLRPESAQAAAPVVRSIDIEGRSVDVEFPDPAHAALFQLAEDEATKAVSKREIAQRAGQLFERFRGFVEDDPEVGNRFRFKKDLLPLARVYREEALDIPRGLEGQAPEPAGSLVDPDLRVDFLAKEAQAVATEGARRADGDIEAVQAAAGIARQRAPRQAPLASGRPEIQIAAQRQEAPESDMTADFDASARAQEIVDETPRDTGPDEATAEADFWQQTVADMGEQGFVAKGTDSELAAIETMVAKAEAIGRGARAAATCMARP